MCAQREDAPKFCVDCGCYGIIASITVPVCQLPAVDLVTGEEQPLDLPCADERSWKNARPGGCGPEGKNWRPKA